MKKLLVLGLLLSAPLWVFGQESYTYETDHYTITVSGSEEQAVSLGTELEAYLEIFNQYFRFDLDGLTNKMKVKVLDGKDRFDTYVQRLIGETRDSYVYLHYSNPVRSELVGFLADGALPASQGLVHQGFVQFLRSFVPNPPLWMREGFATYFEAISYNPETGVATFAENLAWLESYKALISGSAVAMVEAPAAEATDADTEAITEEPVASTTLEPLAFETLLTLDPESAKSSINVFYPQAWALVQYLAQTENKMHNRILWDSIYNLDTAANLTENSEKVVDRAFTWVQPEDLAAGMAVYFETKKTFPDLVRLGMDDYAAGKLKEAEASFSAAAKLNPASYIPTYYLGLINYDSGKHATAKEFYTQALELGADAALTTYALAVNAFADNQYDEAETYLVSTLELDESYAEKVEEIRSRMVAIE